MLKIRLGYITYSLAFFVGISSALGLFFPGTYSREQLFYAAQGIGQDAINLILVVPILVACTFYALRGSRRALLWLGGPILYSLYSYILYAFTLHFNQLFLLYCTTLGLSFFAFIHWFFVAQTQVTQIKISQWTFLKSAAMLQIVIVLFFALLWLSEIIPALIRAQVPQSITTNGLVTNPVFALNLSIVLPALIISAFHLLKKQTLGIVLTPALLGFAFLMSAAIASMVLSTKLFGLKSDFSVAAVMITLSILCAYIMQKFVSSITTFPKTILLIGIPGSGKSTFAKQRYTADDFDIHSTDSIRGELFGDENTQGDWQKIEGVLKLRVAASLEKQKTPIIDATHAQKEHRTKAIAWLNRLGAEVHGLYVATPVEVCHSRNNSRTRVVPEYVINGMHDALAKNPPSKEDGFEAIEMVTP